MKQIIRLLAVLTCVLGAAGCRKEQPPQPTQLFRPHELEVEHAYHAINCGPVTAVFSGSAEGLKTFAGPAPKSYGVESLAFRFADGSEKGFAPTGQLFFSDWQLDLFAPDCSQVALLVDHHGPIHVLKADKLLGYLQRRVTPLVVEVPKQAETPVYGQVSWVSPTQLDFVASAGGGADVWRATLADEAVTLGRVLSVPEAPKGVRRTATGWEAVK